MTTQFMDPAGATPNPGYANVGVVSGGRTVYVSGQIAFDAKNQVVGKGDLRAQAVQVFENVKASLAAAGATFKDVVKINTYVVNLVPESTAIVREVRSQYFAGHRPTSTMVGVAGLVHPDLLIEVEVVAVVA
jgi:enamine deaminase RidA (YjgF/YER057c/UK114 family)